MGIKSRPSYSVDMCFKDCKNRDKKCDDCIRFSEYIPNKRDCNNRNVRSGK